MANQQTISTYHSKKRSFLKPTFSELALYALITIWVLLIYNLNFLLNNLDTETLWESNSLGSNLSVFIQGLSESISGLFQGRLVILGFWAVFGMAVYITMYLSIKFIQGSTDKIKGDISEIKHRRWAKPLSHRVGRHLSFIAFSILLFACSIAALRVLFPALADLAYLASRNMGTLLGKTELIVSALITYLVIYSLSILIKIFIDKWHWL